MSKSNGSTRASSSAAPKGLYNTAGPVGEFGILSPPSRDVAIAAIRRDRRYAEIYEPIYHGITAQADSGLDARLFQNFDRSNETVESIVSQLRPKGATDNKWLLAENALRGAALDFVSYSRRAKGSLDKKITNWMEGDNGVYFSYLQETYGTDTAVKVEKKFLSLLKKNSAKF